jgi:hypothetical protein
MAIKAVNILPQFKRRIMKKKCYRQFAIESPQQRLGLRSAIDDAYSC